MSEIKITVEINGIKEVVYTTDKNGTTKTSDMTKQISTIVGERSLRKRTRT